MIIPSAPLLRRAEALIVLWDCWPTRETLSMMEGDLIFLIVPLGTGSESMVSRRDKHWRSSELDNKRVLHDSAIVGLIRNPGYLCQDQDGTSQSGVLGWNTG